MSLVAGVLEALDIVTVTLSALPDITAKLAAPRTLVVPFGLGQPVGPPHDRARQTAVVEAALALAASEADVPATVPFSGAA